MAKFVVICYISIKINTAACNKDFFFSLMILWVDLGSCEISWDNHGVFSAGSSDGMCRIISHTPPLLSTCLPNMMLRTQRERKYKLPILLRLELRSPRTSLVILYW